MEVFMKKIIIRILLLLLLAAGFVLVFNKQISYHLIQRTSKGYQVNQVTKNEVEENKKKRENFDLDQVESFSSEAVVTSQFSQEKNKLPVIAGIAIPSVDINLPIFKGLSNENLLYGAGTLSPEQQMGKGNYALASHRMNDPKLLFTPLEQVSVGDKIYLTDLTHVYVYQTTSKKRVSYTDTSSLDEKPKSPTVTLITCGEMNGPTRIVVQGELTEVQPMEKTTVFAAD